MSRRQLPAVPWQLFFLSWEDEKADGLPTAVIQDLTDYLQS